MSVGKSLASRTAIKCGYRPSGDHELVRITSLNVYTTAGNPVTTAAAMATIDVIEDEHHGNAAPRLVKKLRPSFEDEKKKFNFIGDVRMYGLDGGIDIDPETGKLTLTPQLRLFTGCLNWVQSLSV